MTTPQPSHRASRPPRHWINIALAITGLVALAGSMTIVMSIRTYKHHAAAVSQQLTKALVTTERHAVTTKTRTGRPSCAAPPPSSPTASPGARMILEAPAISLTAPVLPSDTDTDLNNAVGHLPTSTWPDQGGTVVLEAHDVTFFANLTGLHPGDTVILDAPCRTWTYQVTAGTVVTQGTPIARQTTPTLVMVTCWPTNALYFTNQRYVLYAQLTAATHTNLAVPLVPNFTVPTAILPPGLSPTAVDANTLGVPEGTLTVSPSIDPKLRASASTLDAAAAAIEVFDTCLLAEERNEPGWWSAETNQVRYPDTSPLATGPPVWTSALRISLAGTGTNIASATLSTGISEHHTHYQLTAGLSATNGHWLLTTWDLLPAP